MKQIILQSFKKLISDRYLFTLIVLMLLLSLVCAVNLGLSIKPSELQLVSHYSAFGVTHLYRDQWFYLLVFIAFSLVVSLLHGIISVKLLIARDHTIAVIFAWIGVGIILLGWATALAVLNVWTPL